MTKTSTKFALETYTFSIQTTAFHYNKKNDWNSAPIVKPKLTRKV